MPPNPSVLYCFGTRHRRAGQRERQSRENCECYRLGYGVGYHEASVDWRENRQMLLRPLRSKVLILEVLLWGCLCAIMVLLMIFESDAPWWVVFPAVFAGGFFAGLILAAIQIAIQHFIPALHLSDMALEEARFNRGSKLD